MFLPISPGEIEDYYDFLFICGDAYVDHPSFGHAIISRLLESRGYKVALLCQPSWKGPEDILNMGRPRLGVLVSSGNIDSMVNHYTVSKKPRSNDVYSPGGKAGCRPDRAVIVYCNLVRQAFGDIPIIIGGIESSLRRFAHYDYWNDRVRRSILVDSRADIITYGMGEKQTLAIADALLKGRRIKEITDVPGTCYIAKEPPDGVMLPGFDGVREDMRAYALAAKIQHEEQDPIRGRRLIQPHHDRFLVQNPPMPPLNRSELDNVYALPYERAYHPIYEEDGGVPAIDEVKFSLISARGCFGACSFCALTFHQGRIVQSRSEASILNEARALTWHPDFKGYIHDVGGPTANFRHPACDRQLKSGACAHRQCLHPSPCVHLKADHKEYLSLLRRLRELPNVKKVFVRSGIRYDYLLADKDETFFNELCAHHISGQLKVAPEHVSDRALYYMGKPSGAVYDRFKKRFNAANQERKQYLVPYLMSSHPGSTLEDAIELALYLKRNKIYPEQVQDFYPTPGTLSTAMFYTGLDPRTMKRVYVAKATRDKAMQRALIQYSSPANYKLVKEALTLAGRGELIGSGADCLIRRRPNEASR